MRPSSDRRTDEKVFFWDKPSRDAVSLEKLEEPGTSGVGNQLYHATIDSSNVGVFLRCSLLVMMLLLLLLVPIDPVKWDTKPVDRTAWCDFRSSPYYRSIWASTFPRRCPVHQFFNLLSLSFSLPVYSSFPWDTLGLVLSILPSHLYVPSPRTMSTVTPTPKETLDLQ